MNDEFYNSDSAPNIDSNVMLIWNEFWINGKPTNDIVIGQEGWSEWRIRYCVDCKFCTERALGLFLKLKY